LNTEEEENKHNTGNYPRTSNGSSEHASRSMPQEVNRNNSNLSEEERLIRRREAGRGYSNRYRKRKKDEVEALKAKSKELEDKNEKQRKEIEKLKEKSKELEETIESKNKQIEYLESLERCRCACNFSYNEHISPPSEVSEESNKGGISYELDSIGSIYTYLNPTFFDQPDEIPYSDTPVENNQEGMFEKEVPKGTGRPPIEDDKDMEEEEKMSHYQNESAMEDITNTLEGPQVDHVIGDKLKITNGDGMID